jgi:hypothetical protein
MANTQSKKARLSAADIEAFIADALAIFNAEEALESARMTIADRVTQLVKDNPYLEKPAMYKQLLPALKKAGYVERYAQELLRNAGLYLRKSAKSKGKKDGRAKNGKQSKAPALRGNAKKAFDYVSKLKLTDKQMVAFIAALNS